MRRLQRDHATATDTPRSFYLLERNLTGPSLKSQRRKEYLAAIRERVARG